MSVSCRCHLIVIGASARLDEFLDKAGATLDFSLILPVNKEEVRSTEVLYGPLSEYIWRVQNWGSSVTVPERGPLSEYRIVIGSDSIEMEFELPCHPPIPVVKLLSKLFPDLKFRLYYLEVNKWFAGVVSSKRGFSRELESNDEHSRFFTYLQSHFEKLDEIKKLDTMPI